MKTIIQLAIIGLCLWLFIWLDSLLYDLIIGAIPPTQWIKLIKIILVVVMIIYTTGIVFALTAIASAIALGILKIFWPDNGGYTRYTTINKSKSRFQTRLEELSKKNKKD